MKAEAHNLEPAATMEMGGIPSPFFQCQALAGTIKAKSRRKLTASKQVPEMADREDRMAQRHARTRESHDLADLASRLGGVAVHRASVAGRLALAKPARIQTLGRVDEKLRTLSTQGSRLGIVMCAAVDVNHGTDSPFLPSNALRSGLRWTLSSHHVLPTRA